jgi:hypothetical protein
MKNNLSLIFTLILVACAVPQQPKTKFHVQSTFNEEQAQSLMKEGSNTIKGSALMRQMGGGVVTCAGQKITLIPATDYAIERIRYIYDSDISGTYLFAMNKPAIEEPPPKYEELRHSVLCDSQGFFKFEKIANGEFFLIAAITWRANTSSAFPEGGYMMRKISLLNGEVKEIVIAP